MPALLLELALLVIKRQADILQEALPQVRACIRR
jgi:hypothetical protein